MFSAVFVVRASDVRPCRHPHPRLMPPIVLGIETSCDETAVAIVDTEGRVLASVLASQHEVHGRYGGVVPELAARRHIEMIEPLVAEAVDRSALRWADIGAVAVTQGPGLAGALLVGVSFAKALAFALEVPLLAVNHLDAHVASAWLDDPEFPRPCIVFVVSGGHTHLYHVAVDHRYTLLGRTLDDAAGEAFDKAAKMLGLDYPGGPAIDRLAKNGNPRAIRFPRAYLRDHGLDVSFSGLKTSLLYYLRDLGRAGRIRPLADLAAGFQEAIVDVLVEKAYGAVRQAGVSALAVVGGVSANTRLRQALAARADSLGVRLAIPPVRYCTDNAAMVAFAGQRALRDGRTASWDLEAYAACPLTVEAPKAARRERSRQVGNHRSSSHSERLRTH